ncbi:hypothetical protein CPB84DRAFT_1848313 [Gymnopilus junonius]|uniref:Uncharacterized protein n=1 Tax=Gymnopilus junonius TaxID=109634 RepID=A0A9P5NKI0_GYMJU|nr:hypothetical protein CPB84DRAFT_1848313 [Gymnopilus junonius]
MEVRLETVNFSSPTIHIDDQLSYLCQKALAQLHLSTQSLTEAHLLRTTCCTGSYFLTEHIVLKHKDYPNITYWFRHEYLAALVEGRITSIDNAPVKAQGAEHNEVDDDDDGEEGMGVCKQSSGVPKCKQGKGQASQGKNVKMSIFVGFALEGKLFHSWVEGVDAASHTSYYRDMVARFPDIETKKTKGKTSSKWLLEKSLMDDSSHKKTRVLESTSKSMSQDSTPVNLPDSILQINIIANMPTRSKQGMRQVTTGNQFLAVDPAVLTSSDSCPQYQFSINNVKFLMKGRVE